MSDAPKRSYLLSIRAARGTTTLGLRASNDRQAIVKALRLVDHFSLTPDSRDYALSRADGTRLRPHPATEWAEAAE